jgi:hypothetical protein
MKKGLIYLGLLFVTTLLLVACTASSPGETAKKYAGYIQKGEYEKFADAIAVDQKATPEDNKKNKEMVVALLKDKAGKTIEDKGGIKTIDILSETVSEDGNTAKVVLKQTYGNGDAEDSNFDLVKQDGTWKIVMDK